jgi:hypothetical protein
VRPGLMSEAAAREIQTRDRIVSPLREGGSEGGYLPLLTGRMKRALFALCAGLLTASVAFADDPWELRPEAQLFVGTGRTTRLPLNAASAKGKESDQAPLDAAAHLDISRNAFGFVLEGGCWDRRGRTLHGIEHNRPLRRGASGGRDDGRQGEDRGRDDRLQRAATADEAREAGIPWKKCCRWGENGLTPPGSRGTSRVRPQRRRHARVGGSRLRRGTRAVTQP